MKIDTMRKIDFYVGIPLTFITTLFIKARHLFKKKKNSIQKILFIELSEMGSTIIADPAMRKAKNHFNAELFFAIFKKNKISLDLLKTIPEKNIFTFRDNNLFVFFIDIILYLLWCRKNQFDATIDLELFSRISALLTGCSGASHRVGFFKCHNEGLYRGDMLTHKVQYNPHIHIAKNFISLIYALIIDKNELPYPKIKIDETELTLPIIQSSTSAKHVIYQKIQSLMPDFDENCHSIVLINPNASDLLPQRRWMPDYFQIVIQKILNDFPNHIVLITGAAAERTEAQKLSEKVGNSRCINFAGMTTFAQLVDLYNVSAVMLTNDSGPGHFSAVTPLKTFVIFGPETPALYGSLGNSTSIYAGLACSPCVSATNHRKTSCLDNICLKVLTPDSVYFLIKNALTTLILTNNATPHNPES